MLLACQGFIYDGPSGVIGFEPVWKPEDHVSLFTASEGWGLFKQHRTKTEQTERIELRHGRLNVQSLVFELPAGFTKPVVSVRAGSREIESTIVINNRRLTIRLASMQTVDEQNPVEVTITGAE
jgi:hypothetical protein